MASANNEIPIGTSQSHISENANRRWLNAVPWRCVCVMLLPNWLSLASSNN